jgi:hypothetical protein
LNWLKGNRLTGEAWTQSSMGCTAIEARPHRVRSRGLNLKKSKKDNYFSEYGGGLETRIQRSPKLWRFHCLPNDPFETHREIAARASHLGGVKAGSVTAGGVQRWRRAKVAQSRQVARYRQTKVARGRSRRRLSDELTCHLPRSYLSTAA